MATSALIRGGATPILMYHGLSAPGTTPPAGERRFWISPARFARHLALMAAGAYRVVSLAEVHAGAAPTTVAISFDDGRSSDYEFAFPQLAQAAQRAAFFVNPGSVGTPGYASWQQLREMASSGMRIESHGWTHVELVRLPAAALRDQLVRSKATIEERLGTSVEFLSAPYGALDRRVLEAALAAGYRAVCSSAPDAAAPGRSELPRIAIYAGTDESEFSAILRGAWRVRATRRVRRIALAPARAALGWARRTVAEPQGERA